MRLGWLIILLLVVNERVGVAQDHVLELKPEMFVGDQLILLGTYDGWWFKPGSDSSGIDAHKGWTKLKPSELSPDMADESGKIEGWFTIKVKLDPSLESIPLEVGFGAWVAVDAYFDKELIGSIGNTGPPFQEVNPYRRDLLPLDVTQGIVHELTIHVVNLISTFPVKSIRGGEYALKYYVYVAGPLYQERISAARLWDYLEAFWASVNGTTFFILLAVAFFNRNEKNLPMIVAYTGIFFLAAALNIPRFNSALTFHQHNILELFLLVLFPFNLIVGVVLTARIFKFKLSLAIKAILIVVFIMCMINVHTRLDLIQTLAALCTLLLGVYILIRSWSSLDGAQWAVVVGLMVSTIGFISYGIVVTIASASLWLEVWLVTAIFIATPLSLAIYVAVRFTEIVRQVRNHADEVVRVSAEKEKMMASQNEVLEQQVQERTVELTKSIETIKSAQAQLIQSEKMASLGELTAGIAHEIQNPLNFVNNFSELNTELIDDLKKELTSNNRQSVEEIADSIRQNQQKINQHGKRADAIVKNMLQHSRKSTGQKELIDINALCDEYLRLAYHGIRAKDKTFSAKFEVDLDPSVGKILAIAQDIGRVMLNLINNAFYAVSQKKQLVKHAYEPDVSITTRKIGDKVEIRVKDNGIGIPPSIKEKIFQPFFTTKAAGQGTGLGLSLAYDIVTKAHSGNLKVETIEGEGSEFIVLLPLDRSI
ncbi:MAG TPA: HAMP domain-containing sensor histidine kinase [Chryseolinea sp.]